MLILKRYLYIRYINNFYLSNSALCRTEAHPFHPVPGSSRSTFERQQPLSLEQILLNYQLLQQRSPLVNEEEKLDVPTVQDYELNGPFNGGPVKSTISHTKFPSNMNQKPNILLKLSKPKINQREKSRKDLLDSDPMWWSEYPIPYVGTTSDTKDTKWPSEQHKTNPSRINFENIISQSEPVKSLYKSKSIPFNSYNYGREQVSDSYSNENKPKIVSKRLKHEAVIQDEERENISNLKRIRLENPPLRRINVVVPLNKTLPKSVERIDHTVYQNQGKNPVYNSLMGMISTAEKLRTKRPASHDMEAESLVREGSGASKLVDLNMITPERVKESDFKSNMVKADNEDDWKENLIVDWDPAKTPLTTAVLGSVMLFIILVVVSKIRNKKDFFR